MLFKKYKKILCFDVDGVICKTELNKYNKSVPIKKNINLINRLFFLNYYIKIYTARGMGRSKDRPSVAKNKYYKLTLKQLNSWKVKFHKLHFGKISYDLLVDDKALFFNKNWSSNLMKKLEFKSQMSKGENRKYK